MYNLFKPIFRNQISFFEILTLEVIDKYIISLKLAFRKIRRDCESF